jgi:hypothetical protein
MFGRGPVFRLEHSTASHVPNNLSSADSFCAFAHHAVAIIVNLTTGDVQTIPSHSEPHRMTQVKLITVDGDSIAALLSSNGAEFWRVGEDGSRPRLVAMIALDSLSSSSSISPEDFPFMRGVAVLGPQDAVCVGRSSGEVLVLNPFGASAVSRVSKTLNTTPPSRGTSSSSSSSCAPVADLVGLTIPVSGASGGGGGKQSLLASCDDDGYVRIWDAEEAGGTCLLMEFPPPPSPCEEAEVAVFHPPHSSDDFTPRPPKSCPCTSLAAVVAQVPLLAAGYSNGVNR